MNIAESFATYLQNTLALATLGQDLFVSEAPNSTKVTDPVWWVIASGGDKLLTNKTGENLKSYNIEVRLRARDYKTVYDSMQDLEEQLNADGCSALTDHDTVDIEATTFPVDKDIDNEDRKVGLLVCKLTTFK